MHSLARGSDHINPSWITLFPYCGGQKCAKAGMKVLKIWIPSCGSSWKYASGLTGFALHWTWYDSRDYDNVVKPSFHRNICKIIHHIKRNINRRLCFRSASWVMYKNDCLVMISQHIHWQVILAYHAGKLFFVRLDQKNFFGR